MDITILPDEIRSVVERYMADAGVDFTSPAAMAGECEVHSLGLAQALRDAGHDAWDGQIWMDRVPEALEGNEFAGGHYVCIVEDQDGDRTQIDLTAAQFPELGWTGPRMRAV